MCQASPREGVFCGRVPGLSAELCRPYLAVVSVTGEHREWFDRDNAWGGQKSEVPGADGLYVLDGLYQKRTTLLQASRASWARAVAAPQVRGQNDQVRL